jgi:hypothetical protein
MAAAGASSARGGSRPSSQVVDSVGGNRGAGDRGRTGDVQLGKGAEPGEPGKAEDESP